MTTPGALRAGPPNHSDIKPVELFSVRLMRQWEWPGQVPEPLKVQ